MKKKFSIWLNIVTICLCICAIAVGVYSATTASLKVSGNIGFKAHGCDVKITNYVIQNASRDKTVTEPQDITTYMVNKTETAFPTSTGIAIGENTPFDFGAIYFVDNTTTGEVADIVVKFTITNSSAFNVKATITNPTSANSNIAVTAPESVVFGTETDNKTQDITISMSLAKQNGEYVEIADLSNISISITFAKTQDFAFDVKEGVVVHTFENPTAGTFQAKFPYYIEFGKVGQTSLKWAVIGVDSGNDTMSALTEDDKSMLASGYMPSNKNCYLLSENVLYTESATNYQLSFQNRYTNDNSTNYPNAYGKNANDYATSNIRAYLNGASVQPTSSNYAPSGTEVNFSTYEFTDVEKNLIQPREVSSLMNGLKVNEGKGTISTSAPTGTKPDSVTEPIHNALTKTADNFWLLSDAEVNTVFGVGQYSGDPSLKATVQGTSTTCFWWLRSPYADLGNSAWAVYRDGDVRDYCVRYAYGVRPAFKI